MTDGIEAIDNLFDHFKDRVEAARSDAGVPLSEDTTLYLVQLLTERARTDRDAPDAHTLVELHLAAAHARPAEQARTYRELGDRALYDLGYFRERVARRSASLDYHVDMGRAAYARVDTVLRVWFADAFGPVFRELAERFRGCVDVLQGVRRSHEEEEDLGALYATWLETGDEAVARKLRRCGLVIPRGPEA